jgi:hypothetical protein
MRSMATANKISSGLDRAPNKQDVIYDAKRSLQSAEDSLKNMEKELMSIDPAISNQYSGKLKRHRDNYNRLKQNLENESHRSNKSELIGKPNDTREHLLAGNEILQDTGDLLDNTLKIGLETENIGGSTLATLKDQRK